MEEEAAEALERIILIEAQEKCIKQCALTASKIVKSLSNQQKANLFIARNVIPSTGSLNLGLLMGEERPDRESNSDLCRDRALF